MTNMDRIAGVVGYGLFTVVLIALSYASYCVLPSYLDGVAALEALMSLLGVITAVGALGSFCLTVLYAAGKMEVKD